MFKFRLLLLFVGVCGVILEANSYSYPTAYPQPEASYGYMSYAPPVYPSYSPPSYGSYGKGYGSSYSANCAYMKVIEVLDQIFCQHADKKRYSSTIYPTIDVVIDQLEWTIELIFIEDVDTLLSGAVHELKTLQDAVYGTYGDSSLLQSYYEGYYEDGSQSQTAGTAGTNGARNNARTAANNKMNNIRSSFENFKTESTTFKTSQGVNFKQDSKQRKGQKTSEQKTMTIEVEVDDVSQRASAVKVDALNKVNDNEKTDNGVLATLSLLNIENADHHSVLEALKLRKRSTNETLLGRARARATRSASYGSRKTRSAEYSDYTCSYLSPIYCSEDKYDELLYNILDRLFTALEFLNEAIDVLYEFSLAINCGESVLDTQASTEAAVAFGAILTSGYTLSEVALYVLRMYEIMELDYGDDSGSYYRAGGSSSYSAPQQPVSYPSKPIPTYVNKVSTMQSYPYSGYISQPASSVSYVPQQYRNQRAALTPAIPQYFLVG